MNIGLQKYVWLLVMFLWFPSLFGQTITGTITNKKSKAPIAFASILSQGTTERTTTGSDGKFTLNVHHFPVSLKIVALGYADTIFRVTSSTNLNIKLSLQKRKNQKEVTGDVMAIAVVKKAIEFRKINDPESNYPFTYNSYSKMVFGPVYFDSLHTTQTNGVARKRYKFMSETVTKRKFFPPDFNYESVVGNRFSGLLNPDFTIEAGEFQPFSFYKDYVQVLGLNFMSPLARKSYHNYDFTLTDSYYEGRDTLYVIQFLPKKGTTFKGLKGIMVINSNKYAIQNIRVSQSNPYSQIKIELEQISEYIDTLQWFPVKFITHLVFDKRSKLTDPDLILIDATGETYIRDIKIGAKIYREDFKELGVVLSDKANTHTKKYWRKKRENPAEQVELNTYKIVDSLGRVNNYDRKQLFAEGLPKGDFPIGPISIEFDKVFDYNNYEGARLGLGVRTNDKVSKYFSVGGYGAYGFRDKQAKYGADLDLNISRKNHVYAGVKYKNDVIESGGNTFYKTGVFNLRTYSNIYVERMDMIKGFEAYFKFRALRDFQNKLFYSSYSQSYNYDYTYVNGADSLVTTGETFNKVEVGLSMRFGFREQYARMLNQSVSLGTRFPYLWFRIAYSDPSIGSTFKYTKLDAKINKSYRVKGLGKIGFMVMAGKTFGDAPSQLLHYGRGMRSNDIGLYIESAFNTMHPNEFLSDQYVSIHANVNFGVLYKTNYSAPELSLVTALGWGSLENPENHVGINIKTMEKGFFESGLVLDNIIAYKLLGVGAGLFYRYGDYAFDNSSENLVLRFSVFYMIQ